MLHHIKVEFEFHRSVYITYDNTQETNKYDSFFHDNIFLCKNKQSVLNKNVLVKPFSDGGLLCYLIGQLLGQQELIKNKKKTVETKIGVDRLVIYFLFFSFKMILKGLISFRYPFRTIILLRAIRCSSKQLMLILS